jgi:hypothetical protein
LEQIRRSLTCSQYGNIRKKIQNDPQECKTNYW